jgi:hypothetical protein
MPALRPDARRWVVRAVLLLWPLAVGAWFARGYLILAPDELPANHELHSYVYRLVEFRDLLAAGYWSPQWATHFRYGLGSPYFGYYQPGFFYLASLVPWSVEATRALGWTVIAAVVFGFVTTFAFIRSRFGPWSAFLGATAFVVAPYVRTELIARGDLSELTGMMLVPFALHRFLDAVERGRGRDLAALAAGIGAVIVVHPAVGLLVALALGVSLAVLAPLWREWGRGLLVAAAMGVAVALAGFYVLPVALETRYVSFDAAFEGLWDYRRYFAEILELLLDPTVQRPFRVSPGRLSELLVLCNVVLYATRRREWSLAQRRFFGFALLVAGLMLFLMTPASRPVWDHVAMLQKMQFPGRALAVLTPAMALAIGAVGGDPRPSWRLVAPAVLTSALVVWSLAQARLPEARRFTPVAAAAEIATVEYFRPDVADEWLPRGATDERRRLPRKPSVSGNYCALGEWDPRQGRLAVPVQIGPEGCVVTLPHFFFPVGWRATLDGADGRVTLDRTADGFMQLRVAPGASGLLAVEFSMTPMRRLGWVVTALAATVGLGGLALLGRRRADDGA